MDVAGYRGSVYDAGECDCPFSRGRSGAGISEVDILRGVYGV